MSTYALQPCDEGSVNQVDILMLEEAHIILDGRRQLQQRKGIATRSRWLHVSLVIGARGQHLYKDRVEASRELVKLGRSCRMV